MPESMESDSGESMEVGSDTPRLFDATGGSDSYVTLHRRDDLSKKMVFHGRLSVEEASEENVAKLFGGGYYRAQLREPDERGTPVIRRTREFQLPGRYRPPQNTLPGVDQPQAATASPATVQGGGQGGNDSAALLNTAIVAQVIDLMKVSKEMASARPAAPDLTPLLIAQMNTQMKMFEAMMSRAPAGGDARTEVMALFKEFAEMMKAIAPGTANTPSDTLTQLVGAIKQLREVSDEFSPQEAKSDPLLDSIPKLTEVLASGMAQRNANPQPRRQVAGEPINPTLPIWQRVLLREKPRLLKFAESGTDPEFCAEMAIQFMPSNIRGAMLEFVRLPDFIQQAATVVPELQAYPDWANRFLLEARALLLGDEGEDDVSGEVVDENVGDQPDEGEDE